MHSFELRQTIDGVLLDVAEAEPFFAAVATLSLVFDAMAEPLQAIAEGGNRLPEATNALHSRFAGVARVTAEINPRRFYQGLDRLQLGLAKLLAPTLADDKLVTELAAGVEAFALAYDAFLSRPGGKTAIPLVLQARRLHDRLPVLLNVLAVLRNTQDTATPDDKSGELTLALPAVCGLADFAQRLFALDALYTEVCLLLAVSRKEHPLRIARIESGSLWVRVFGERRAMAWLADCVESAAAFMYRNYTAGEKFSGAQRSIEAIDNALGLSRHQAETGADPSKTALLVARCAPALFKHLAVLLDGQPSVRINEATVSIGDELSSMLLKGNARS